MRASIGKGKTRGRGDRESREMAARRQGVPVFPRLRVPVSGLKITKNLKDLKMATLESLDGKTYNIPDDVLARYRIGEETVGQNVQKDELPVAPPPQTGWDEYGERFHSAPSGLEGNPFVKVKRGEGNKLIINVLLPK
jgi:hypothetical protein